MNRRQRGSTGDASFEGTTSNLDLERLADLVADRVVDRLRDDGLGGGALLSASQLARRLGVDRSTIYRRAVDLGARRVGGAIRFDLATAEAAIARSGNEGSRDGKGPAQPTNRRRRQRRQSGRNGDLLPVGRRERRARAAE